MGRLLCNTTNNLYFQSVVNHWLLYMFNMLPFNNEIQGQVGARVNVGEGVCKWS